MKVSCLMATHGRFRQLKESVSTFLEQDVDPSEREMIIVNSHPVPLVCRHPCVRVYNEPHHENVATQRTRLLELSTGEFIRMWDDDDLYLPWSLTQALENIGDSVAWKPSMSWFDEAIGRCGLVGNTLEASVLFNGDFMRKLKHTEADWEHADIYAEVCKRGGVRMTDMGVLTSFIYRWGYSHHLSGTIGNGMTTSERSKVWKTFNQDSGNGEPIEKVDLAPIWEKFFSSIRDKFPKDDIEKLRSKFASCGYPLS